MADNNQQPNDVNNNNPCSDPVDEYFRKLPPGIRLRIFDDELVDVYLFRKVHNLPMIPNTIHEVDLYNFHPQELTDTYPRIRSKEWYFFTHRYRKYPNGRRPRRAAAAGFWKPTGTDKPIPPDNPRGYRKCLDYYQKHPEGFKTIWKMHEYTLISQPNVPSSASPGDRTKLGDWVLCKIYKKRTKQNGDEETVSDEETESLLEDLPEFAHNNAQVVEEPCPNPGAGARNGHETIDDQQVTKFASEAGSNLRHFNESCQLKSSWVGQHNNAQVVKEPCPNPGDGARNGHETIDDQQVTKFASEAGSNLRHFNESCQLKSSWVGQHNNAQVVEEPCPNPGAGARNGHETIDDQQVTKFASEAGSNLQHWNESCQLRSSWDGHSDLTMADYLFPDFDDEGLNEILASLSQPQEDNNNLVSCGSTPQPSADSKTDGLFPDQASIRRNTLYF